MQIARVIGNVVATQKMAKFEGAPLLLVQPLNPDDTPRGQVILAIDSDRRHFMKSPIAGQFSPSFDHFVAKLAAS